MVFIFTTYMKLLFILFFSPHYCFPWILIVTVVEVESVAPDLANHAYVSNYASIVTQKDGV